MQNTCVYCDFTGVYGTNSRLEGEVVRLGDIEGTTGYCSDDAKDIIRERIGRFDSEGIHLLDNGNYHYMSYLWLEKIKEDFDLVVFDRHTDMQESALIPVMSCGNWILEVIKDENIPAKNILVIGVPDEDIAAVPDEYRQNVVFVSQKKAEEISEEDICKNELLKRITSSELPVYLSVDKDVFSEDEIKVNWEQGTLSVSKVSEMIRYICGSRRVIGIDICGEPDINESGFAVEVQKSRNIDEILIGASGK